MSVSDPDLDRVARLFADPARARMLRILMDGTRRPAGELAYAANVSAQSASAHLAMLVGGGLIVPEPQGRHRYFRIASADVAHAIETLASLSVGLPPRIPPAPLPSRALPPRFLYSRTCYDHLAGELAVKILAAMLEVRWLVARGRDFSVSESGVEHFLSLDVDLDAIRHSRRNFACACVDLTQRRPHLGGALGAALLGTFLTRGWILRSRQSRAVTITPKGSTAFAKLYLRDQR